MLPTLKNRDNSFVVVAVLLIILVLISPTKPTNSLVHVSPSFSSLFHLFFISLLCFVVFLSSFFHLHHLSYSGCDLHHLFLMISMMVLVVKHHGSQF